MHQIYDSRITQNAHVPIEVTRTERYKKKNLASTAHTTTSIVVEKQQNDEYIL